VNAGSGIWGADRMHMLLINLAGLALIALVVWWFWPRQP
jgi:plastocyanin domain-containing protein